MQNINNGNNGLMLKSEMIKLPSIKNNFRLSKRKSIEEND